MLGLIKICALHCKNNLLNNSVNAEISADLRVLTVQQNCHSLLGFVLQGIEKSNLDEPADSNFFTVESFSWHKHQENGVKTNHYILVGNDTGEIKLLNVITNGKLGVQTLCTWMLRDINSQILLFEKDTNLEYEVLAYRGNNATICIEKQTLLNVIFSHGQPIYVKSQFPLTEDGLKLRHIQYLNNVVCTLSPDGMTISAYDLENGDKLWQYSLLSDLNVSRFYVSSNSDYLVLVKEDEHVYLSELLSNNLRTASVPKCYKNVITAFSKQSVALTSKENGKNRMREKKLQNMPCGLAKHVLALENRVYICTTNNKSGVFHSYHYDGTLEFKEKFPSGCLIVHSSDNCCPPLILAGNMLYTYSPESTTTDFVNKLMMYSSGHTVEYLSLLNEWQGISIELDVLKLSLKNIQLDTVVFFLRVKCEEFRTLWKNLRNGTPSFGMLDIKLKDWVKIFGMLEHSLEQNLNSNSFVQFAEQILKAAINVLVHLIKTVSIDFPVSYEILTDAQKPDILFTSYLKQLRQFLESKIDTDVNIPEKDFQHVCLESWSSLNEEEIIRYSLENSCVPIAMWYFKNHNVNSVTLDHVQELARKFSVGFLEEKSFNDATKILINSGLEPIEVFIKVFQSTTDKRLRNFLLDHLGNSQSLSDEDLKAIDFVHLLETLYPCDSFELAKCSALDTVEEPVIGYPIQSQLKAVDDYNSDSIIPILKMQQAQFKEHNSTGNFSYCRISLDLVKVLTETEKEEVLVPALLAADEVKAGIRPSPNVIWNYLLKQNSLSHLLHWINVYYETVDTTSTKHGLFPNGWPLSAEMVNSVISSSATIVVKETVLDAFAKYGIICEDELEDVNLLLKRLGSAGVFLVKPHPFSKPGASMKENDYYHRIVHYCLEHSLFNFLYYFLQEDGRYKSCTFCPICSVPLVLAMIDFCRWSENPSNESLRYQAILSSSCLLNNISESSIGALCKESPAPTTLATMMFSPSKLSEILKKNFSDCDQNQNFKEHFENAISTFPMLNRVLVKGWPSKNNCDVSIYSLLMGNCFFDPSRLFGWQSANTIASEEAPSEIPHFSSPHLVQHALNQNLDVRYYLVEGRPSYAYLKFVAQELVTGKTLSNQRLTIAYQEVTNLALQNYATLKITASCITFIELLGMSSLKLRVDIQIASILHSEKFAINEVKENKTLALLLVNAMELMESAKEVAEILDSLISKKISLINNPQNHEFYLFLLLAHFCQFHHLDYLPSYFNIIAKRKDWFTLTILFQVLMIHRDQALEIVQQIPDKCLIDHLTTAFKSPNANYGSKVRVSEPRTHRVAKRVKPKAKGSLDARSFLYLKIGLPQNGSPQASPMETSDEDTVVSDDGSCSTNESNSIDEYFGQPKDLFEQLILVSKSTYPGLTLLQTAILFANPVHALISASLTNTDWLLCSCTWIIAILKLELNVPTEDIFAGKIRVTSFTLTDLSALLVKLVELGYLKILNRCALFFLPHSPILPLTDTLVTFFYSKKFRLSTKKLQGFKLKMENFKSAIPIKHAIGDVKWTENTILMLVKSSLISCKSSFERKTFLHQLCVSDFGSVFSNTPVFNYQRVYSLLLCVEDCKVDFPMEELLHAKDDPIFARAAYSVVTNLQLKKMYDQGRKFGFLSHLPKEKVLIMQLNFEADSLDESFEKRKNFWEYCDKTFDTENIEAATVVSYFNNWCEKALTYVERYYILVIIVKWSKKAEAIDLAEKEMAMWLCCFQCKMESLLKDGGSQHTELVIDSYVVDSVDLFQWELWDFDSVSLEQEPLQLKFGTEKMALDEVLLKLLDLGYIGQAWKLAIMFQYYSLELEAVLTCLKLVREVCMPCQINSKVAELINMSVDDLGKNSSSLVDIIDKIQESLEHGKIACRRIKIHYLVSQILWTPYTQIAAEDSIRLFVNLLNCSNPGKFNLAKEFLKIRKIPDNDVVNCIYTEISDYVKKSVILAGAKVAELPLGKSNEGNIAFSQQVFRLCEEPSLLGYKLLGDIAASEDDSDCSKCHIYQVAICVSCHACFTSCCSMEGISKTLRKAHQLTLELEEKKEFPLMLSLLTGIGRYGEMTYIFDILREHEQFDILLRKSTEELPLLRLALLDYLKRHHDVSDREAHSMLAVKFKMFREIAEMLENSAKDRLKKLHPSDIAKPNFRSSLEAILQDLEASTKKYLEDGCVRHAQNCLKLAELVALQIHLSHSNTWILSLDEPAVHKFLVEHKHFLHSLIVASAYQHHRSWDQALYQNLIERGDWDYFRDFQGNLGINPTVIGGVAKRYSLSTNKGERQQHNMKRLLNLCEDVVARYQIANQLGFMDITSDLLKGDAGAYLQDIVSQKRLQDDWLLTSI